MAKIIKVITTNKKKLKEFEDFFNNYGITVVTDGESDFILSERTILCTDYDKTKGKSEIITKSQAIHLESVFTKSILHCKDNNGEDFYYESEFLEGIIDLNKISNNEDVFGWDDIFVLPALGLSLYEISKMNSKVSGRQENLATFVKEHIHYKKRLSTKFNFIESNETILIDDSVEKFIRDNKYLRKTNSKLRDILLKGLKNGAFFRASKTRREKNYWFPGLNAGIPLVEKSDAIHEITFGVHDLFHFVIPDIIFNGNDFESNKKTYILSRMMSEAISLVLADGWFIQTLKEDSVEYDYSKRCIYPLFEKLDLNNEDTLKEVITNMVYYVLKGEESYLYNITSEKTAIDNFKNKYDAFFVEDYKWTFINYNNMVHNKTLFKDWFSNYSFFIKDSFFTVEDFDGTIEPILEAFLNVIFSEKEVKTESNLSRSFKKYMLGNMFIFSKFKDISISDYYFNLLNNELNKAELSLSDCKRIKRFYGLYIEQLANLSLIDKDQEVLYKEIYPLFDPSFAFYDKEKDFYKKSISDFYLELQGE